MAQIAVIANKSVKVEKVSPSQLYDLYTGDIREWDDGQSVVVYDLKLKSDKIDFENKKWSLYTCWNDFLPKVTMSINAKINNKEVIEHNFNQIVETNKENEIEQKDSEIWKEIEK